jgi:cation:H+ antiporter
VLLADVAILLGCAAAILVSGSQLVRHADRIASWTPLGRTRVGILLLATVTSIPEIISATTAVTIGEPDLASGNLLGTLPLNLSVLALASLILRHPGLFEQARHRQGLALAVGACTVAVAGVLVLLGTRTPVLAGVGIGLPFLVAGYAVLALRPSRHPQQPVPASAGRMRATIAWLLVHAAVVAGAAAFLPRAADGISGATALDDAFLGAAALAAATTLPELTVAFTAVRMRADDLAIGNAIGSMLFNLALLAALDLVHEPGSLIASTAAHQAAIPFTAVLMLAILAIGRLPRGSAAAMLVAHVALLGWLAAKA